MDSIEAGFEPRPTKLLGLVLAVGGEERFDPGPLPVAGSASFQRERPLIPKVLGGRLGWCSLLQENEGFLGTSGGEQGARDRGGCVWSSLAGLLRDERVDVAFVVGDACRARRSALAVESKEAPGLFRAWARGQTGYPLVDAGMRELWHTGYMHNRVRMITASFLAKDLLVPWQKGAAWFWDTLCDADLANNSASWQWVAACGTDAAPYFRIFNPASQAAKFDPEGAYIRRWVPELGRLPSEVIHAPHAAPGDALEAAGVMLGETYPQPIVDHGAARQRALEGYRQIQR